MPRRLSMPNPDYVAKRSRAIASSSHASVGMSGDRRGIAQRRAARLFAQTAVVVVRSSGRSERAASDRPSPARGWL